MIERCPARMKLAAGKVENTWKVPQEIHSQEVIWPSSSGFTQRHNTLECSEMHLTIGVGVGVGQGHREPFADLFLRSAPVPKIL